MISITRVGRCDRRVVGSGSERTQAFLWELTAAAQCAGTRGVLEDAVLCELQALHNVHRAVKLVLGARREPGRLLNEQRLCKVT